MTTMTTALSGRLRFPTTRPDEPCRYCGTAPTAIGELLAEWGSVCTTCAATRIAQVKGLAAQITTLAAQCDDNSRAVVTALITDTLKSQMRDVLGGSDAMAAPCVSSLLTVVATARRLAVQATDPTARSLAMLVQHAALLPDDWARTFVADVQGRYDGRPLSVKQQAKIDQYVQHVERRLNSTTAEPSEPSGTPLCGEGASRCIRNKIARKCIGCAAKVPVGTGWSVLRNGEWTTFCETCADSTTDDRHALVDALRQFGADFIAAHGDTRDHAIRVAIDASLTDVTDNDTVWLRIHWGAIPCVERHSGGAGDITVRRLSARRALIMLGAVAGLTDAALTEAQADYGRKMSSCGRCGSPLTDETSRRIGLGPDCAKVAVDAEPVRDPITVDGPLHACGCGPLGTSQCAEHAGPSWGHRYRAENE